LTAASFSAIDFSECEELDDVLMRFTDLVGGDIGTAPTGIGGTGIVGGGPIGGLGIPLFGD
jgi:hypothetical protein